mgnify:CR=1 FL=1
MIRIGSINLPVNPLFLAPMEDVTDRSFRHICKEYGADVMISEFIASEGLIRDCQRSKRKMQVSDFERPFGIQLYGHRIDAMIEAVSMAEKAQPDFIDLNFGCPVKKIATRGAGAGMLKNIPFMRDMTKAITAATSLPVTAKTRLGWDKDNISILETAKILQDSGIQALTIHGRTRAQMYKGEADWDSIAQVKHHPDIEIPIIGNGDISTIRDAKNAFDGYGVDGVMIGRAAVGKPWLFNSIKYYLESGEKPLEPSIQEKSRIAKKHFSKSLEWKGYPRGLYEMRKHFTTYFKGLPNFREMKRKLVTSLDPHEIYDLLDLIAEKYAGYDSNHLKSDTFFHY